MDFYENARVIGLDGGNIGTLTGVDESSQPPSIVVEMDADQRLVRIPVNQIDETNSSSDRIVTTIPAAELMQASAALEESGDASDIETSIHQSGAFDRSDEFSDTFSTTIPLAEEELTAHTRETEKGRVVIRKRVETVPHETSVDVSHEDVEIDRVSVDREIDDVPAVRHEDDTIVVPVVEEMLVVEKRLRLVEEVRVTKRRVTQAQPIREDLRREVVDVFEEGATQQES